jgi:1-acyl-sn-glycerol-3-phosphate acyltransferase
MGLGAKVSFDVHAPIENKGNIDALIVQIETAVKSGITSFK